MAKVLRRKLAKPEPGRPVRIYPLGDMHLGAAACDEKRIQKYVQRIAEDPNAYWIGMGDYGDFINRNDRRFNAETLAPWLHRHLNDLSRVQTKRFVSLLSSIAGRCLALCEGNHERCQQQHYERNVFYDICDGLKQAGRNPEDYHLALGYTGWLVLTLPKAVDGNTDRGTFTLKLNVHHGSGGATTRGGRMNKLLKYAGQVDADLVLMGHTHDVMKVPIHMRHAVGSREVTKPKWAVLTGSFLDSKNPDGYTTYGEEKMYAPLPPGNIVIEWRPQVTDIYRRIRIVEEW